MRRWKVGDEVREEIRSGTSGRTNDPVVSSRRFQQHCLFLFLSLHHQHHHLHQHMLSPACPALFCLSHTQLSELPKPSNTLCSCVFCCFPVPQLFSSLSLYCGFAFSGEEVEAGGEKDTRGEVGWWCWGMGGVAFPAL